LQQQTFPHKILTALLVNEVEENRLQPVHIEIAFFVLAFGFKRTVYRVGKDYPTLKMRPLECFELKVTLEIFGEDRVEELKFIKQFQL